MAKKPILNPDPSLYKEDECPSFAEANQGMRSSTVLSGSAFSYTAVNIKPINWWEALENPKAHGGWKRLARLASEWCTCACGNECVVIPRVTSTGRPKDSILYHLGIDFSGDVNEQNSIRAKRTLQKIEDRSLYLIRQIYAKLHAEQAGEEGTHG